MNINLKKNFSIKILIFLITFLVCIAVYFFSVIMPDQKKIKRLNEKARILQDRIDENNILSPLLNDIQQKNKFNIPDVLIFPQKTKLANNNTNQIQSVFSKIAEISNLKLETVVPDVNTLIDDSGQLMVEVSLSGDFFDFRNFLVNLINKISFMENIEQIQIKRIDQSKQLEFFLKIWLAKASFK